MHCKNYMYSCSPSNCNKGEFLHTIGYVRISNPEKQDPASQVKLMQDREIVIEDIFIDMASGTIPPLKRPQYKKMIDRISKGDITELVVSEFSRIGRTVNESLMEVLSIQQKHIKIQSLASTEKFINELPVDMQPILISAMMYSASLERKHISERTKWGMDNAKEKGTKSGIPIGRPKVEVDFEAVRKLVEEKNLKEAQAIRVLGIKARTFYAAKKLKQT